MMFLNRKTNSPSPFMKFGVDDHGFLVPVLRRPKSQSLQLNSGLKPCSLRPKVTLRARG
jgi:hypothetical protein